MKKRTFSGLLASMLLVVNQSVALAEDIDLFLGTPPGTTEVPNVLIILDNTANWSRNVGGQAIFVNEKAALVSVFNELPVDKFRVGLMMSTETGSGDSNIDGGYVRAAIRSMNATNKPLYKTMINSFDENQDKGNGGKSGLVMAEAYRYFAGKAPYSGNNKNKTDYAGNVYSPTTPAGLVASMAASRPVWALPNNALNAKNGSPYNSPIVDACAKNFIIYISNGASNDNNSDTTTARNALGSFGGDTTAIPISPSGSQDNVMDEWARFMKASREKITTYTIDVDKVTTGQGPGWTALLKSVANVSGGKYFDVQSAVDAGKEIRDALEKIFTEILAVNSVFASVSLPASTNTQSTFLNQVFVGMFRPDGSALPRWPGNLKQYKLDLIDGNVRLVDADSVSAINAGTGFITGCARSFWTPPLPSGADNYWAFKSAFFQSEGPCLTPSSSASHNSPDGQFVEKGGQAYRLRSTTTRTVYTCSPVFTSCTSLVGFNNTTVSQANLGAASTAERDALINWARGLDLPQPSPNPDGLDFDENTNGVTMTEMRPSAHGDVIHSRPVVVNYGTDASPQVVVFYSGNDGMLRAINGNRSSDIGSTLPGAEFWAFMPPEFYPHIKRIRENNVQVSFPGTSGIDPAPLPKPYGIDGPLTAYKGTIAGESKVFLYAAMRRGGRAFYAFDVTNVTSPTLKWKIGCPNNFPYPTGTVSDTGCSSGLTGIGQTWATPSVITSTGYGGGNAPMLIMGGGYDTCEDYDNGTVNNSCATTKGNRIYVLDANTGAVLTTLNTDRSVVAGMTVVPDALGRAQYAYTADMGGNIYRVNIGAAAPTDWTLTKIASLGCDTISSCNANRKFLFAPDVVKDASGNHFLLIGSGDREKPLLSYVATTNVANYFFMVKDVPFDTGWLDSENARCGANVICFESLTPIPREGDAPSTISEKGWRLEMNDNEQVVTSAITVANVVTFSTHQPANPEAGSCGSNLGTANVYNIFYKNAEGARRGLDGSIIRYAEVAGGGLPPSPVAGRVRLDNGTEVPFLIGGSPESPLEGGSPTPTAEWDQPKQRVYWYLEQ